MTISWGRVIDFSYGLQNFHRRFIPDIRKYDIIVQYTALSLLHIESVAVHTSTGWSFFSVVSSSAYSVEEQPLYGTIILLKQSHRFRQEQAKSCKRKSVDTDHIQQSGLSIILKIQKKGLIIISRPKPKSTEEAHNRVQSSF